MGRKNPIAAVYKLTNTINGKIYIGETCNFTDRMSTYKTHTRPGITPLTKVEAAIQEYGWENFDKTKLVTSETDPKLVDMKYRRKLEAAFIAANESTNPDIGYNVEPDSSFKSFPKYRRKGTKHSPGTRILKSDPIFVYDINTDSVMTFFGKKSFADYIGKDRSIVARCASNGKATSHYIIFWSNPQKRKEIANKVVAHRTAWVSNRKAAKALKQYVKAMKAVEKYAKRWNYKTYDVKKLLNKFEL